MLIHYEHILLDTLNTVVILVLKSLSANGVISVYRLVYAHVFIYINLVIGDRILDIVHDSLWLHSVMFL